MFVRKVNSKCRYNKMSGPLTHPIASFKSFSVQRMIVRIQGFANDITNAVANQIANSTINTDNYITGNILKKKTTILYFLTQIFSPYWQATIFLSPASL